MSDVSNAKWLASKVNNLRAIAENEQLEGLDQKIYSDNPCWGSPEKCDLQHLFSKVQKKDVVIHETKNYLIFNKPPDLRMDGPYPSTVHKVLTFWFPPPSINTNNEKELLSRVSKLHQHNHVDDNALRPCHQLDYATSGILCVARTHEAASAAGVLWEGRKVSKSYLAVIHGHIKSNTSLPVLKSEVVLSTLSQVERSYRNRRGKSKSKVTFNGFMPPHAIFCKWKSVRENGKAKKKKRRRASQLSEEQWSKVWEPIEKIVPETAVAMDWKDLCKNRVEWKKTFVAAAAIHNRLLRNEREAEEPEKGEPSLPTLFMVEEDLYIFCPLAQASSDFTMKIPLSIAQLYPSVAKLGANDDEEDFKPSLTRCQIIEEVTYRGRPATKVKLWPITGRRHQLRVHTALSGHAILGDVSYSSDVNEQEATTKTRLPPRMCLHAYSLALPLLGERQDWSITTTDPFSVVEGELVIKEI
ncbi:unnamed protein product [Cylindrotheca closterium]|uniref:Pseudouridine synthase RsuA/RluA-like domain-containing protein n=1 Tax=Cylindrotheca closterium TaxID=2856 RepID=A0AAD2FYY1_9STRA|nr:unnamed protein product [Cylindrotheca closterium]